ncbi:SET domain protein (macronuclear) [Tetrahymena thermophila SB210]|uniref:SET domain protein n=1 Tax=Tetrahymena thermophila (strain SB210) TaxID=312017 RepID=I7LXB5_TETTS|nr:SET domain protein [Tetrahymena thermophila SB210]EAS04314.2 SET domain protein [Tetrahymena thermophila SB210]|eukprot:XP_001024559.2 SET domain protein [Tetrahymena thermophila SB210]
MIEELKEQASTCQQNKPLQEADELNQKLDSVEHLSADTSKYVDFMKCDKEQQKKIIIQTLEFTIKYIEMNFKNLICHIVQKAIIYNKQRQELIDNDPFKKYKRDMKQQVVKNFFKNRIQQSKQEQKVLIKYDFEKNLKESCLINHNIYSNYIPIRKNLVVGEIMPNLFPCLKIINNDGEDENNQLIQEFQIKNSKNKTREDLFNEWLLKKNAHVLFVDIRETLLIDFLLNLFPQLKLEVIDILRIYIQQEKVKQEAFDEKIQYVLQNYCDPIQYPYGITIDDKIITDQSVTSTFKSFFCHRCYLYDCRNHENKKELNFKHPATQLSDASNNKEIKWLQLFYKEILLTNQKYKYVADVEQRTESYYQDYDMKQINKQPCSKNCYLNMNLETFEKIKAQKTYNEFELAYIKAAIKRLSYNPCYLNLIDRKFNCAEIFVFLVKYENVLSMLSETKAITKKIKPYARRTNNCFFNKEMYYEPCCHYYYDEEPKDINCQDCGCSTRGFCDIYCGCDPQKCKRRRQGCKCIKGQCKTKKCACFLMGMECDPEHCKDCFDSRKDRCKNNEYLYQKQERTVIGMSFVCQGLGLYNVFPIQQHSLVLSYLGEYISEDEQVIRESWLKSDIFYTFTKNDFEKLVDSKYFGNKSRFMNHHISLENCFARSVYSRGDYHLGLYAKQDIPPGNELLFDYDADKTLAVEKEWITRNNYSNYKIRMDNIRITIPRNKDLTRFNSTLIIIDDENDNQQKNQKNDLQVDEHKKFNNNKLEKVSFKKQCKKQHPESIVGQKKTNKILSDQSLNYLKKQNKNFEKQ